MPTILFLLCCSSLDAQLMVFVIGEAMVTNDIILLSPVAAATQEMEVSCDDMVLI